MSVLIDLLRFFAIIAFILAMFAVGLMVALGLIVVWNGFVAVAQDTFCPSYFVNNMDYTCRSSRFWYWLFIGAGR